MYTCALADDGCEINDCNLRNGELELRTKELFEDT
jgi:hypothetical protein